MKVSKKNKRKGNQNERLNKSMKLRLIKKEKEN